MEKHSSRIILGLIVLIALALRLYHLDWALPHTYEEARPLHVAFQMWGWDRGGDVTLNPHFFNYPSLVFYLHFAVQGLLYAGLRVVGSIDSVTDWQVLYLTDPSILYVAERGLTAAFGVASVWAIARLGSAVAGRTAGFIAALLLALNPFHIASSQRIDVDVPLTFFVIVGLWMSVRIAKEPARWDHVTAGLAIGLAASSKYTGLLLVLPLAMAHFLGPNQARRRDLGIALAAAAVAFFCTSPYVLLDFQAFQQALAYEQSHMAEGHFGITQTPSWNAYARALGGRVVSAPLIVAACVGAVLAGLRRRDRGASVLLSFALVYLVIVSTWRMRADRYLLPALPTIAVMAAMVPAALSETKWKLGKPTAVMLVVLACILDVGRINRTAAMRDDARTEATGWIERTIPHGAFILTEHYGPDLLAPPLLMQLDPALRGRVLEKMGNRPVHAVQKLPMFQTQPERSAPFYSLELYPWADYVITSSAVRGRYEREPARFAAQLHFYAELDASMNPVETFAPPSGVGDHLIVYQRLRPTEPFALLDSLPSPPFLPEGTGTPDQQASYYYELGANSEFFGIQHEAYVCYIRALDRRPTDPQLFLHCAIGATRTLLSTGQNDTAVRVLARVATAAPDAATRERIDAMRVELEESLEASPQ